MAWTIRDRVNAAEFFRHNGLRQCREALADQLLIVDPDHHEHLSNVPGQGLQDLWYVGGDTYAYQIEFEAGPA